MIMLKNIQNIFFKIINILVDTERPLKKIFSFAGKLNYKIQTLIKISVLLLSVSGYDIAFTQEFISPERISNSDTIYNNSIESVSLEIQCHSGTPPVLEFVLTDPEKIVENVSFDFENDGVIDLHILRKNQIGEVVFRGIPYRKEGNYLLTTYLETKMGKLIKKYQIGFTRFVWGIDNFSFANDGKFEDGIDFVSQTVLQWAEERFGEISSEQKVLLLYLMYNLYKGSIGRCYGFSGGEIRFMLYPEKLPPPYWNTFSIIETDPRVIRDMDFIQNDIVFGNFVSQKIDISSPQSMEELEKQIKEIKKNIDGGNPVILGYISADMHHSMVVYGYIEDLSDNSVTLITANNWEREQKNNVFSEDAENIVIKPEEGKGYKVSWFDLTKEKYRYPEKIFAVPFKNRYRLEREDFFNVLKDIRMRLIDEEKSVLMIEKVEDAYLVDEEGRKGGYQKPDNLEEIKELSFNKIDNNYVFEFSVEKEYTLVLRRKLYNSELKRYKEVNLFLIIPGNDSLKTEMIRNLEMDKYIAERFKININGISKLH